ncbi:MBL fold metallo-hydrolase [Microbacterium karelineae]|uniref:MBL fold metallo-hydrolase n=1 Tax=Microbacterium karelineae TaxID=2654283 RepID=UPI0012EADB98|nr:MBL fold metallo-hydrolase [Microbacterium karelineae]
MRVTKHEHAFLTIERDGETLVVDPGAFTAELGALENVVGVVVTHEHPDHWTPDHLRRLAEAFPDAPILTTAATAAAAPVEATIVSPGDAVTVGSFALRFFGGTHNEIHSSLPLVDNVGVLVDDAVYYPGDSYAVPEGVDVALLAAPIGAPWLKIGEAMDFVLAVAPRAAFGTHDVPLSDVGLGMHRQRLAWATEQGGGTFHELAPGESIDIAP